MEIRGLLRDAQQGQVYANLARAFHLAPTKVEVAVDVMLDDLVGRIERNLESRNALAGLVELLGQNSYEQVLDSPSLLGATHTQVIGNEALNVLAGHGESESMTKHAATEADISEMIAEYLLPVVAVLLVAALARLSRDGLAAITGQAGEAQATDPAAEAAHATQHLPLVAGGVGFSGSTGGTIGALNTDAAIHYVELAEKIKRAEGKPPASDPAIAVRKVLASCLGYGWAPIDWISRARAWGLGALRAAVSSWAR